MFTVVIDIESCCEEEAQTTLEHIAHEIGRGVKSGEGFEVEGTRECDEHECE